MYRYKGTNQANLTFTLAMSRPCANCWLMLKARGVKWAVYTVEKYPFYTKERI